MKTNKKTLINQIVYLLNELTIDYQNSQLEQQKIATELPLNEEEFSLLEEIEILTVNLRGYAIQVKEKGCLQNTETARQSLQQMAIFEIPTIVNFYFEHSRNYPQIKNYLGLAER